MNSAASSNEGRAEDLCLSCGLCCNGVIFARVQLQPGDDAARLRSLGLPLPERSAAPSALRARQFPQPCSALDGCRCRIYPERPHYCRQFECLLLKSVEAGKTRREAALEIIGTARQRADKVRRLLRELGDTDERTALSARFRRTARRLEKAALDEASAATYGELTMAVHDLNFLLSQSFYPGDPQAA
ncbi:MAG TPA: YkgJ family cysteine cluster protein [Candidatus Binatia bacterium]|jgi:Fe-S-cluster containining protein|nr:YkgJ family cysteine cluster protein [Candidatus Binatia bacterium]